MTKPNEPEGLEPCPFCGAHLRKKYEQQGYWHEAINDCPLSLFEMEADGYSERRWNRRDHAHPVADAGGVTDDNSVFLAFRQALIVTWKRAEPDSEAAKDMFGHSASFTDMAAAVLKIHRQSVAAATAGMPTIWEDPAGKGYPCFERPMTPAEAKAALDQDAQTIIAKDAEIARLEDALSRAAMRFDLAAENGKERAETYRKWASEARAALSEAREAG